MKTVQLLIAALLLAGSATAQQRAYKAQKGDYTPTVYLISAHEVDTIYTSSCDAMKKAAALNSRTVANATQDYMDTHRCGTQQVEKPQFIFATKRNTFSLALGGFIALRAAYDFDGIVDNMDFIPYDIPVPGSYDTRQALMMDATTSRFFIKAISNTRALGRVVFFIDMDFRGGAPNSYIPRLRTAYVSFKGLTLGRDITTFCDLQASPTTIDFQGPNAYNLNFATLIRYERTFANRRMSFGVAAEMPMLSGMYNENFAPIPQRMPDFPMYLQLAWGTQRDSHIRLSGVLRNLYYQNMLTENTSSLLGWGAQLSGTIKVCPFVRLFMNGVYGEGITPYIQDLTGSELDFTPNPENPEKIQTMPMWGWQAAAQFNVTRRMFVSGGFSMVRVERKNGVVSDDEYRQGQYAFGNVFYQLTPRCHVGAEYLYGTRLDMDGMENHANRINVQLKYNF